jgi:hypothetical protein
MEVEIYFKISQKNKRVSSSDSASLRGRNCTETSDFFFVILVLKRFEPDGDLDPIFIFAKNNNCCSHICQKNKLFPCLAFVVHHMTSIFAFRKRNGYYLVVTSADHPILYILTTRLPLHILNEVSLPYTVTSYLDAIYSILLTIHERCSLKKCLSLRLFYPVYTNTQQSKIFEKSSYPAFN